MKQLGVAYVSDSNNFQSIDKACVPLTDTGFQRGVGVFEVLITYKGKPMALKEHLERLKRSSKAIGLKQVYSSEFIEQKILEGISKVPLDQIMIRIIITGGDSNNFLFKTDPRLAILFLPLKSYPEFYFTKGVKLLSSKLQRIVPEIKSLNYLAGHLAFHAALKKGYHEGIYVDRHGEILEGTTFNFAIIVGNTVISPEEGILPGITIEIALKLAKKLGLRIQRRPIHVRELPYANEAFLTSSNREIMPVVQVDDIKIGDKKPGPVTCKLLEEYRKLAFLK
jgi:branched-chain amino acid aminotransferase